MRKAGWLLVVLLFAAGAVRFALRDRGGPSPDTGSGNEAGPGTPTTAPVLKGKPDDAKDGPAETPAPGDEEPAARTKLTFTGRVLIPTRHPVPGATVIARSVDRVLERTSTDGEGRFTVNIASWPADAPGPWVDVEAPAGRARRALFAPLDAQTTRELGAIVLDPVHALTVRVTSRGSPVAGADVVVRDERTYGAASHLTSGTTDEQGVVVLRVLASPDLRVYAGAEGHGRASETVVSLPHGDANVELELPPDRSLTVTVLEAETESPVADAEVLVAGFEGSDISRRSGCLPPLPSLRTDDSGRVRVSGLPAGTLYVVARTADLTMPSNGLRIEGSEVPPDAEEVTVHVQPYRAIRFPIEESEAGVLPDGTELEVVRFQQLSWYDPPSSKGRVEDAHVVIEPFPPGHDWGYVQTPDGLWAEWITKYGTDVGDPVTFRPLRDVEIRLRYRNGAPAARELLELLLRPRGSRAPARTDLEGRLVFEACRGRTATVTWKPNARAFGTPLATIDLLGEASPTEITIDRAIDIEIGVTIDGRARLPAAYRVRVPDTDPRGLLRDGRDVSMPAITENPDAATLRFRWLRNAWKGEPSVTFEMEGYPPAVAHLKKGADRVWRGIAAVHASAALHVRVLAPEDTRYYLRVERWFADQGRWVMDPNDPAIRAGRRAENGVHRYQGLRPGRYRLKEHYTGLESQPFELASGGAPLEMGFDLRSMVLVEGKVVLPEGYEPAYASVHLVEDAPTDGPPRNEIAVQSDGTFEYRALRGQRLRFEVRHPVLKPAAIGGTVEVEAGRTSPTLRLEAAEQLVFRVEGSSYSTPLPDPRITLVGPRQEPLRVRLAPAGTWTPDAPIRTPLAKDGVFRLSMPHAGRWDLRLEMIGRVPKFLLGVEVGGDVTDLGALELSEGATLTLRLHSASDQTPPYLRVTATLKGDLPYTAHGFQVEPGDPPTVVVRGLGPGTFRLRMSLPPMLRGKGEVPEREIQSDGATPITIDISLP